MKHWEREEIDDIRNRDIVSYLNMIGHLPEKLNRSSYWYLSPLRNENTASFKVDQKLNRWYDFGTREGGDMIDLILRLKEWTFTQLMESENPFDGKTIQQNSTEISSEQVPKILIEKVSELSYPSLKKYLEERGISWKVARLFCAQVNFELYEKKYFAIGFPNDLGGYELRSSFFKWASSPKTVTRFLNGSKRLSVFEGFFDFLSHATNLGEDELDKGDYLILNSISFINEQIEFMDGYENVDLYLDRDETGQICSRELEQANERYSDKSTMYSGFKDLNEWWISKVNMS
ncbi:toprim domain-containing protein [Pedobacter sp. UBA4863]|uniref:toprim domain-containing protein n=1 Tax=Pedobacter sp. UBA4863 TaxID=1947060 RepID=UPI0025E50B03|nr:toprim domain-containing protein [Pedobacter sp. UBA4863]